MSKEQINLPKTAFSMRANLPIREPKILEFWKNMDLYKELRNSRKGKEKFILHDGPPYACLLYTSPSPRDRTRSRMPSSA